MVEFTDDEIERFESSYKEDLDSGCWVWQKATHDQGYGKIQIADKFRYAHRASYLIHVGDIPEGKQINHECHNEPCVNPDHLYAGTQAQNIRDAMENGDYGGPYGESHGQSKLCERDVMEIRMVYDADEASQYELADVFGVSRGTIQAVVNRETWEGVEPNE